MMTNHLSRQVLALPVAERFALMRELQDSLNVEGHAFDPQWLSEELDRRLAEDELNPERAVSLDAMQARLSSQYGWDAGR